MQILWPWVKNNEKNVVNVMYSKHVYHLYMNHSHQFYLILSLNCIKFFPELSDIIYRCKFPQETIWMKKMEK